MALSVIRVLIGAALLMFGAVQLGISAWLVTQGVETEGKVTSTVDYGLGFAPVLDFTTLDGRHLTAGSRIRPKLRGVDGATFRRDFAKLHYDPSTPSLAILADPADLWIWPGSILLFGILVSALGPLARRMWGD